MSPHILCRVVGCKASPDAFSSASVRTTAPERPAQKSSPIAPRSNGKPARTVNTANHLLGMIKDIEFTYEDKQSTGRSGQILQPEHKTAATIERIAIVEWRQKKRRKERERLERRRLKLQQECLAQTSDPGRNEERGYDKAHHRDVLSIKETTRSEAVNCPPRILDISKERSSRPRSLSGHQRNQDYDHYSPPYRNRNRSTHDHYSPSPSRRCSFRSSRLPSCNSQTPQPRKTSQPTPMRTLFASTPPNRCQTCRVDIAEIERTSSFQFPTMCPICHQPRSLLPLDLYQQQAMHSPVQQHLTPALTPPSNELGAACANRRRVSPPASPSDRLFPSKEARALHRDRMAPAARGVRPGQSYRPTYTVPRRRSSYQSPIDVSGRWEHDRFATLREDERGRREKMRSMAERAKRERVTRRRCRASGEARKRLKAK